MNTIFALVNKNQTEFERQEQQDVSWCWSTKQQIFKCLLNIFEMIQVVHLKIHFDIKNVLLRKKG